MALRISVAEAKLLPDIYAATVGGDLEGVSKEDMARRIGKCLTHYAYKLDALSEPQQALCRKLLGMQSDSEPKAEAKAETPAKQPKPKSKPAPKAKASAPKRSKAKTVPETGAGGKFSFVRSWHNRQVKGGKK